MLAKSVVVSRFYVVPAPPWVWVSSLAFIIIAACLVVLLLIRRRKR